MIQKMQLSRKIELLFAENIDFPSIKKNDDKKTLFKKFK